MEPSRSNPVLLPVCPRCGYDLSGQVRAFGTPASPEPAPTEGRCSECGLQFAWFDVFNPDHDKVRGFIEHERGGWWATFKSAWRTWWMAMLPLRFWKKVRLEHAPRPRRVLLWALILLVGVSVIGAVAASVVLIFYPTPAFSAESFGEIWAMGLAGWSWRWATPRLVWLEEVPAAILGPLFASVAIPLVMACLPDTRRVSQVRAGHLARGAVYGLAWLVPVIVYRALAVFILAVLNYLYLSGPQLRRSAGEVIRVISYFERGVRDAGAWWLFVFPMAWVLLWWYGAVRFGWRIEQYNRVWWALAVPALLAATIALFISLYGFQTFVWGSEVGP